MLKKNCTDADKVLVVEIECLSCLGTMKRTNKYLVSCDTCIGTGFVLAGFRARSRITTLYSMLLTYCKPQQAQSVFCQVPATCLAIWQTPERHKEQPS